MKASGTFEVTEAGREFLLGALPSFPDNCPGCGFTDDCATWILKDGVYVCGNGCGYVLQNEDVWATIIE